MTPMLVPSLIETVRVIGGTAPLWTLHVRRLAESCRATGVPLPLTLLAPGGADRVVRLEVGLRGVTETTRAPGSTAPVRLATARTVHAAYPHKTTERAVFERAAAEAREAGADDALLLTHGGEVAEASIWSVFWWESGRVCAPPYAVGVLRGVARLRLDELTGGVLERRLRPAALAAHGAFVANAARGVVPIGALDGATVPLDAATADLQQRFWP